MASISINFAPDELGQLWLAISKRKQELGYIPSCSGLALMLDSMLRRVAEAQERPVQEGNVALTLEQAKSLEHCAVISFGDETVGCPACGALYDEVRWDDNLDDLVDVRQEHEQNCWLAGAIRKATE